jgi:hypothetical protein
MEIFKTLKLLIQKTKVVKSPCGVKKSKPSNKISIKLFLSKKKYEIPISNLNETEL